MSLAWIPRTDTEHYDTYAQAFRDAVKRHQYKNAKDWEDALRKLDAILAKQGEP